MYVSRSVCGRLSESVLRERAGRFTKETHGQLEEVGLVGDSRIHAAPGNSYSALLDSLGLLTQAHVSAPVSVWVDLFDMQLQLAALRRDRLPLGFDRVVVLGEDFSRGFLSLLFHCLRFPELRAASVARVAKSVSGWL